MHLQNKTYMKKIIILLVLFQFISCDTRYDGDIRLQFTGKVLDDTNNPIPNQEVTISAENENLNYISHNVGFGKTDSNGNYSVLIPSATNLKTYTLKVNDEFEENYNSQIISAKYYNIKNSNFTNNKIQLPTSKLYFHTSLSVLAVTFNKINSNNELQSVEYIGEIANENIDINYEIIEYQQHKRVKKNQIIEIKYKVKNQTNSVITTISDFVNIDTSSNINHSIDY